MKDTRTNEELNRIIHRWIGYVPSEPLNEGQIFTYGYRPDNSWGEIAITDYCTDLNAIHEAEKKLSDFQWDLYEDKILEAVENDFDRTLLHAEARQRAEALVAVIEGGIK